MGRGCISWNIPSLTMLDTARNGLLNVAGMDTLTARSPVSAAESLKALRIKRRILPVRVYR